MTAVSDIFYARGGGIQVNKNNAWDIIKADWITDVPFNLVPIDVIDRTACGRPRENVKIGGGDVEDYGGTVDAFAGENGSDWNMGDIFGNALCPDA